MLDQDLGRDLLHLRAHQRLGSVLLKDEAVGVRVGGLVIHGFEVRSWASINSVSDISSCSVVSDRSIQVAPVREIDQPGTRHRMACRGTPTWLPEIVRMTPSWRRTLAG